MIDLGRNYNIPSQSALTDGNITGGRESLGDKLSGLSERNSGRCKHAALSENTERHNPARIQQAGIPDKGRAEIGKVIKGFVEDNDIERVGCAPLLRVGLNERVGREPTASGVNVRPGKVNSRVRALWNKVTQIAAPAANFKDGPARIRLPDQSSENDESRIISPTPKRFRVPVHNGSLHKFCILAGVLWLATSEAQILSGPFVLGGNVIMGNPAAVTGSIQDVDAYQNFSGGTVGNLLTTNVLGTGASGGGSWRYYTASASDTTFQSWTITNRAAFTYRRPLRVGSTVIYDTGTNAIFYDMDTANAVEQVRFFPPGATYLYSNLLVSFFIQMGAVPTGGGRNYDHIHITGGYFCVCQQQTSEFSAQNRIISHSQHSLGSTNGPAYDIDPSAWYHIVMIRDFVRQQCRWKIYDPTTFELLGSSLVGMGTPGTDFGAQVVEIQAHYLNQQPGTTTIMGVSASYADPALDSFEP